MLQEVRFATFNVCNLALPGVKCYDDLAPLTQPEYDDKIGWIARQLDRLDADVIGFQEIFSQVALRDVLARTYNYRDAHHIGFEPEPQGDKLSPSVALISRLPVVSTALSHTDLPQKLSVDLPGVALPVTHFTRPILQADVTIGEGRSVSVFVCHLKSKLPDYRNVGPDGDPDQFGIAVLRSLIRRGADALGLRYLVAAQRRLNERQAVVVMGDFNDVAGAIPTQMVMGTGRYPKNGADDRLFECYRIQSRRDPLRDVGYTHIYDGNYETIDHILVSEEFNPASPHAIGEVLEVIYLNDHMALKQPEASDHGQVLVRVMLYDGASQTGSPIIATPDLPLA